MTEGIAVVNKRPNTCLLQADAERRAAFISEYDRLLVEAMTHEPALTGSGLGYAALNVPL